MLDKAENPDPAAPPPIPPKVPGEQLVPTVEITEREGERIEEYSQNGRVYMIKITPNSGPPYYLVDPDGSGDYEMRRHSAGMDIQVPQWSLISW